jgi:uncharacterized coiled-coil protein SlyX
LAAQATIAGSAPPPGLPVLNRGELDLMRVALENISWSTAGPDGKPLPVTSAYQEIQEAIPELIYRHPWFKFLIGAIILLIGLLATGTAVFYGVTFNLKQTIEARSEKLLGEVEAEKTKIEKDIAEQRAQSASLNSQLDGLVKRTSAASTRLGQLQAEANQKINDVTSEATQKIDSEVKNRLPSLGEKLDAAQTKALAAVAAAGVARAEQVTLLEGGQGFRDRVKEFDGRSAKAITDIAAIEKRQKDAVTRLDGLFTRQAILEKITHMSAAENGRLQNMMAVYFETAVVTVWVVAIVLTISCLVHIFYFARWAKRKIF